MGSVVRGPEVLAKRRKIKRRAILRAVEHVKAEICRDRRLLEIERSLKETARPISR